MKTWIQPGGAYRHTLSREHEPIATIEPGEPFQVETVDAFFDRIRSEADVPSSVTAGYPYVNPLTGPFHIAGAEKGDALVVHIDAIEATRDYAVTALVQNFGALTRTAATPLLHEPLPERSRLLPLRGGRVWFDGRRSVPMRPFLGTIGVAPELEGVSSLTPGPWGGNMDCVETAPGARLTLPVFGAGAYLFVGDAHACQGDGEVSGVAAEMPARVSLRVEVHKGAAPAWPRIETDEALMSVGSARPLEDAARIAWAELVGWLAHEHGFGTLEAYEFLGLAGAMRVGNVVDPNYSMVAKIEKALLKPGA
jgi:acetamidase/formamidase